MKSSPRVCLLVASVACLAVLAGVLAVRSFASITYYCDACTLPSSGVPAVSAPETTFYNNYMQTAGWSALNYWEQIYYYDPGTDLHFCTATAYGQAVQIGGCGTSGFSATARCHFLNGTGPSRATCQAEY